VKSKGIFIFIAGFMAAAAIMFYMGISMEVILFLSGPVMIILGIALLIKEMNWRKNSDLVSGKVTRYHIYTNSGNPGGGAVTMYTMEAEYITSSGKLIIANEQSGSSSKKYPEGTSLKIRYSREDPYLFIVEGDNSRIYAMLGVIVMGVVITAIFGSILRSGINIQQ